MGSSSRDVTPCETPGGNVKQISIMAFVKKRKEAAIAATKSPPKVNSKQSDVEPSDGKLDGTIKADSESDRISSSDKTLVNETQSVEKDVKKIPTTDTKSKKSSKSDKRKSTIEDGLRLNEANANGNFENISGETPPTLPEQGKRRKGRLPQKDNQNDSPEPNIKDKKRERNDNRVLGKVEDTQIDRENNKDSDISAVKNPVVRENSSLVRPESGESPPIKIGKKKLAMAGKYEKERQALSKANENTGMEKDDNKNIDEVTQKEHQIEEKISPSLKSKDMSKDNSEKKAVEEKQIANASVPLNEENKEQLKNGTSQTNEFEN